MYVSVCSKQTDQSWHVLVWIIRPRANSMRVIRVARHPVSLSQASQASRGSSESNSSHRARWHVTNWWSWAISISSMYIISTKLKRWEMENECNPYLQQWYISICWRQGWMVNGTSCPKERSENDPHKSQTTIEQILQPVKILTNTVTHRSSNNQARQKTAHERTSCRGGAFRKRSNNT